MPDSTIRVLVFGGTGTGKTSLCNTLTGRSRPTGNGAQGVTTKSHLYNSFECHGRKVRLFDTVGLHESSFGTVPAETALAHLVELLTKSKDGFNLLIHVARAPRITKEQEEDYQFFVEKMTQGNIPVLLVLTGCENEEPMDGWMEQNSIHYKRFEYKKLIATCFASGGKFESDYADLRLQSRQVVLKAILENALSEPYRLYGQGTGTSFSQLLTRLWNYAVDLANLPQKWRGKVNESAYDLLKRLGASEEVAALAKRHIPDLASEVVGKLPIPGSSLAGRFLGNSLVKFIYDRKE